MQDLLAIRCVVDSFGSIYTPGLLTDDITNMFSPATTFDTFYFKNSDPFLVTSLPCVRRGVTIYYLLFSFSGAAWGSTLWGV